ncbi:hypothetical protein BsWGS_20404 [Bradybaena similaris]
MANQFGTGKNPPWARQDFTSQAMTGILQSNLSYPYSQSQPSYAPQALPAAANLQPSQAALLTPGGLALPATLTGTSGQVGALSYPMKPQTPAAAISSQKQRIFTGIVTKLHENFGFVDEEVFFQTSCVKGVIPKVGDRVLVEAVYNANMPFKWNATSVVSLVEAVAGTQIIALSQQQQQQQQHLKTMQQQALGAITSPGIMGSLSNITGAQGLSNPPPSLMPRLGKFQSRGMFNAASRPGINTVPGLQGEPVPRSLLKDKRSLPIGGQAAINSQKEREKRDRDRRERHEERRKHSRSPVKRPHSPPPRLRSPPKRKAVLQPPRYVVQVPKILLDVQESCVMSLKSKYSNLYIPSDFFHTSFSWVENFPLAHPFTLGQACNFQIMHKDVPPVKKEQVEYEPEDADYLFSAKVMLLASPTEEELYKKSCCLAEDMPDCMDHFQHPTRLLQFLVGTRGKNEPMAIGGPWSPSLDGPNPQSNPHVLIKTAIRTTKALTGIDLSSCTQWYRFAEIRYFRAETKHKERVQPARVETVIIFLPDVWICNPTRLEWVSIQAAYQKQLQQRLNPGQQQEEEEEIEEPEVEIKNEPSHYSTLDPKVMKVGEMRRELELRNISFKGLKSQLVARLTKTLKSEQKEQESKEMAAEVAAEEKAAREEEEKNKTNDENIEDESKTQEDEEQKRKEKRERAVLERRYKLSETPSVLVHPSATAKGSKFDCSLMSLSLLLDYRPEDNKEHSFEVSLFAELFNEMLMRDFGFQIYKCIVQAAAKGDNDKKEAKDKDDRKDRDEKDKDDRKDREEKDKGDKKGSDEKEKDDEKDIYEKVKEIKKELEEDNCSKDQPDDTSQDEIPSENKEESPAREKSQDREPSPKRTKSEQRDKSPKRKSSKDTSDQSERMDSNDASEEAHLNDDENEDKEKEKKVKDDKKRKKPEEKKPEEKSKKKTVNPDLLLACSYFDQNHCGYLTDKDTEDIIHTLGLKLSRAQVKKILQKVLHRDTFQYRKFTDHDVGKYGVLEKLEQEESSAAKLDAGQLARGNKESLRKLLELSKVKTESMITAPTSDSNNPRFLHYRGALLDVESLMQRLDRSEKTRYALEKNCENLQDELKQVKTQLVDQENASSRLEQDLSKTRAVLDQEKTLRRSVQSQNTEWQIAAIETRYHLAVALSSLNEALNKEENKSPGDQNEIHKKDEEEKVDKADSAESLKEEVA